MSGPAAPICLARSIRAGFSLIEIVLALGIISFALVGILGLFPVAVKAAADSQHETQASLIARSIFDQLEASPDLPKRTIKLTKKYDASGESIILDLAKNNPVPTLGFDADGAPLAKAGDPKAVYTSNISVKPLATPNDGLSQVTVTVSFYAVSYPFISILRRP